jgi:hypothetical protein
MDDQTMAALYSASGTFHERVRIEQNGQFFQGAVPNASEFASNYHSYTRSGGGGCVRP